MSNSNLLKNILIKCLNGFFVGITLLMISYISIYFISGKNIFCSEISQLQNVKILIFQMLFSGLSYYLLFINFYTYLNILNDTSKAKYFSTHLFIYILFLITSTLIPLLASIFIFGTQIFSKNISTMNILLCMLTYIIFSIYLFIKSIKENQIIKKINKKIK